MAKMKIKMAPTFEHVWGMGMIKVLVWIFEGYSAHPGAKQGYKIYETCQI